MNGLEGPKKDALKILSSLLKSDDKPQYSLVPTVNYDITNDLEDPNKDDRREVYGLLELECRDCDRDDDVTHRPRENRDSLRWVGRSAAFVVLVIAVTVFAFTLFSTQSVDMGDSTPSTDQFSRNEGTSPPTMSPSSTQSMDLPYPKQLGGSEGTTLPPISEQCQELGITPTMVAKSRAQLGNTERWHRVMRKEGHIKVAALGGSVTAGNACAEGQNNQANHTCAWPHRTETMLGLSPPQYQPNQTIQFMNFAAPGRSSTSGGTIVMQLKDFDVIIFHWTANDDAAIKDSHISSGILAAFETVVRTALALPHQPAVIILEGNGLHLEEPLAEEAHYSIARVYDLPVISARAAFWHHHLYGEEVRRLPLHVPHQWHARYACLVYENWIQESHSHFEMAQYDYQVDFPPVFGGKTLKCENTYEASALSETLEYSPIHVDGWSYFADVPGKFGYITNTTDSVLQFELFPKEGKLNILILHYLESYTPDWGSVKVSFSNRHKQKRLKGRRVKFRHSQTQEATFELPSNEPFTLSITGLGGKFKLQELFLFSCDDPSTQSVGLPSTQQQSGPPVDLPYPKQLGGSEGTTLPRISDQCQALGITPTMVAKSRAQLGNTERWHRVMRKEGHIKVAALGGSVTAGHECAEEQGSVANHACAWPHQLETMFGLLPPQFQPNQTIEVVNFGAGGVSSLSGDTIVMQLKDFDVIIFHWTANDDGELHFHQDDQSSYIAAFETDVRTALALPHQPAVIIFEGIGGGIKGHRFNEPLAEEMHYSIARVYDLPVIAARSVFWHHHLYGEEVHGLKVHVPHQWHVRYACLVYENWIQESHSDFEMSDYDYEVDIPPVFGGKTLKCNTTYEASALSETLEHSPVHVDGWSYFADRPEKFGYITNNTGSVLQFELFPKEGKSNILILQYLRSYTPEWGSVKVSFSNELGSLKLKAFEKNGMHSQTAKKTFGLPSNEPFNVTLTGHWGKFKLQGLFLFSCD